MNTIVVDLVGCNSFQAKSGRICYIIYVVREFHHSQVNAHGFMTESYFVDQQTFDESLCYVGQRVYADIRFINGTNAFLGVKGVLKNE